MMTRRVASVLAGALALLGGISACKEDAETKAPEVPVADSVRPPELAPAWTVDGLTDLTAGADRGQLKAWVSEDRVVLFGSRSALALDPVTGEELWRAEAKRAWGKVCGIAETPGEAVGATLFGKGDKCARLAALDLEQGEWSWRHDTGVDIGSVSVGDDTVAAVTGCGQVTRWDVDGEELKPLFKATEACEHESAIAGSVAVVRTVGRLTAYDVDSGRETWQTEIKEDGTALFGVASADPLVLDESAKGHRVLTRRGPKGAPLGRIGLTMGNETTFTPITREGSLVLGRYGDRELAAYDLATGEAAWSRPADDYTRAIGLSGGWVLMSRIVAVGERPDGEVWISAQRLGREGAGVRLLGRLPTSPEITGTLSDGNRLYVLTDGQLAAYDVPTEGEKVDAFPDAADAIAMPEGDLTPEAVTAACRAVEDKTLAMLGFRDLKVPPPADCRWNERFDPIDAERTLTVSVKALPATPDDTAWTAAARLEDERLDARASEGDDFGRLSEFTDDAWIASRANHDGSETRTTLVARYRNAVIEVHGVQRAARHGTNAELVAPDRWADGIVAAASSILTSIGASATAPQSAVGKPTAKVPDVCKLLGEDGTALVSGAKPEPTTPRDANGRISGCLWSREMAVFPELLVTAYAVPGGLDATSAVDRATRLYSADGDDEQVKGLGDEAKVWGFRLEKADEYGVRVVTARRGNLIVNVSLGMKDADPAITQQAVEIARTVLSSS